jgi:hypothetical protein
MYANGKMISTETISGMGGRGGRKEEKEEGERGKKGREGGRRAGEGVNSSNIHLIQCKNFCKCHNVPPPSTTIKLDVLTQKKS